MKRSAFAIAVSIVGMVCLVGEISLLYAGGAKNIGIVNSLQGEAHSYREGSDISENLNIGNKIYVGDTIITGKDSKMQLIFRDDSAITMGSESELTIDVDSYNMLTGKRESILFLAKGKIRSVVGKAFSRRGSSFQVRTNTAILGVRGTENVVVSQPEPAVTQVYSIENVTYVRNVDDNIPVEVSLSPKQGAKVLPGQPPELFEFEFEDPAVIDLMSETYTDDGGDVELDIEMDALDYDINRSYDDGEMDQKDERPPYEQESTNTPPSSCSHGEYHP